MKRERDAELLQAIMECRRFIGPGQISVMLSAMRGEEDAFFREKFLSLAQQFATMPKTYDTEPPEYAERVRALEEEGLTTSDAQAAVDAEDRRGPIVHLHYFIGSADWYIIERDREPVQLQAFGHADLYRDGGELGYICIPEITRGGAELDLHWTPRPLAEVIEKRRRA